MKNWKAKKEATEYATTIKKAERMANNLFLKASGELEFYNKENKGLLLQQNANGYKEKLQATMLAANGAWL